MECRSGIDIWRMWTVKHDLIDEDRLFFKLSLECCYYYLCEFLCYSTPARYITSKHMEASWFLYKAVEHFSLERKTCTNHVHKYTNSRNFILWQFGRSVLHTVVVLCTMEKDRNGLVIVFYQCILCEENLCMPVTKLIWMLSWKIKSVSFHLTDKIVQNSWWSRDAVEIALKAVATETQSHANWKNYLIGLVCYWSGCACAENFITQVSINKWS